MAYGWQDATRPEPEQREIVSVGIGEEDEGGNRREGLRKAVRGCSSSRTAGQHEGGEVPWKQQGARRWLQGGVVAASRDEAATVEWTRGEVATRSRRGSRQGGDCDEERRRQGAASRNEAARWPEWTSLSEAEFRQSFHVATAKFLRHWYCCLLRFVLRHGCCCKNT